MSAREWVVQTQPKAPVKWGELERAAFADHPSVLDQLDPGRKFRGSKRGWELVWGVPAAIVIAAVFAAPIWGFTTLVGDRFGRSTLDPSGTIPAAGIIFGIGLVLLVVNLVRWLRAGRPNEGLRDAQAGLAFVLGLPSVGIAALQGTRNDVSSWPVWTIPIAASTVVGGIFLAMLWSARRATRAADAAAHRPSAGPKKPLERVTEQVELLPPLARDAVRADLDAAVSDLQERRIISESDAEVARRAELGLLKLRMYQQSRANRARGRAIDPS